MRCESRQEAGNIMMVPVKSVACRQFKTNNTLFFCALACKCVRRGFNLQTCFTIYHWHTITVNHSRTFYFSQACSEDVWWRGLSALRANVSPFP